MISFARKANFLRRSLLDILGVRRASNGNDLPAEAREKNCRHEKITSGPLVNTPGDTFDPRCDRSADESASTGCADEPSPLAER